MICAFEYIATPKFKYTVYVNNYDNNRYLYFFLKTSCTLECFANIIKTWGFRCHYLKEVILQGVNERWLTKRNISSGMDKGFNVQMLQH